LTALFHCRTEITDIDLTAMSFFRFRGAMFSARAAAEKARRPGNLGPLVSFAQPLISLKELCVDSPILGPVITLWSVGFCFLRAAMILKASSSIGLLDLLTDPAARPTAAEANVPRNDLIVKFVG
jgi:hypothetical protein